MKNLTIIFIFFLLALSINLRAQQAGVLDLTFNTNGYVQLDNGFGDLYTDVKIQPDGKIVAVGTSFDASWGTYIQVTRLLSDGSYDPGFGTNGVFSYTLNNESGAYACEITTEGKILVCGYTTDYGSIFGMLLLQLNADGTLNTSFGTNGVTVQEISASEDVAFAMNTKQAGRILLAGYSTDINFNHNPVIVGFDTDGKIDSTFGVNGVATIPVTQVDNDFSALGIQSDGKILAAGHISNGMSWFSLLITRFSADGTLDTTYANNGIVNMNLNNVDDEFFSLAFTAGDEAVLSGFSVTQSDLYFHCLVMKFDINGSPVTGFGNNGKVILGTVPYAVGNDLLIQPDGKIVVTGALGNAPPGNSDWALWRLNADGSMDNTFGTNGVTTTDFYGNADEALALAFTQDKIIVAGKTRNITNQMDFVVARYTNDITVSIKETPQKSDYSVLPNPVSQGTQLEIKYEIRQTSDVTLEVLNMTGSSVALIPLGIQAAGNHTYQLSIPYNIKSGVYYLRMSGPQYPLWVEKIVVID